MSRPKRRRRRTDREHDLFKKVRRKHGANAARQAVRRR